MRQVVSTRRSAAKVLVAAMIALVAIVSAGCSASGDPSSTKTGVVTVVETVTTSPLPTTFVTAMTTPATSVPTTEVPTVVETPQVETPQVETPAQTPVPNAISAGDACIGAQTGSFAYDASGTQLVCTNYHWEVNVGQRPGTSWGDGQREWAECMKTHTQEECREQLNP